MAVDHTKSAGEHADGEQGPAGKQEAPAQEAPAQEAPAPPGQGAKPDLDDMKRKFREALDRKRGVHGAANSEGTQDTGKVHGSHGPAASRRSFRRKSGS